MPHSKEFVHNYALQANIGTTTGAQFKASVTRAFLLTICEGDKEKLRLLQEMCGVLISDLPLKGAIFWIGAHDSGKSTLAKLLKSLFLPEHFSAVPLEKFDDKFRLSQLVNTRLNVGGEISRQTNALQWKLFKELTGGDTVSVEAKYVNALNVEIRTKLLFLGNFMPNMPSDDALYDRINIFNFNYSVPPEERDRNLLTKLQSEINIFADWCVKGAVRFVENNFTFSVPTTSANPSFADPVVRFANEHLTCDRSAVTITKEIYGAFSVFFELNYAKQGLTMPTKNAFYAQINELFPEAHQTRKEVNGHKEYVFTNIRLLRGGDA